MSVDEMVGRALRDLADEVRPEHDPYGRIRVRHRRSRRRRTAVVATTVAGALAVAGA
ncbi:MAG: WD40 repeat domain-containing protein, partial [Hamadaea sp.]|nr:WD40 repeat domain-containing protein [Hamadaea sp.]